MLEDRGPLTKLQSWYGTSISPTRIPGIIAPQFMTNLLRQLSGWQFARQELLSEQYDVRVVGKLHKYLNDKLLNILSE